MKITRLDADGNPIPGSTVHAEAVVRVVDISSPDYLQGVRAANLMLDTGMGADAAFWVEMGGIALDRCHQREDVVGYHVLAGMVHTLREFLEGQT